MDDKKIGPKTNGNQQAPRHVEVEAKIDLPNGTASFSEKKVNGIIMIDPHEVTVPIQTIVIMAAQAILAMNGIASGPTRVTKEGQAGPAPKLTEM